MKPVKTYEDSTVRIALWKFFNEGTEFYKITITEIYKTGDKLWKFNNFVPLDKLLNIQRIIERINLDYPDVISNAIAKEEKERNTH
jgi:hypothetical protein